MIAAVIQARMGSSRLPGKVLADLAGQPMLHHVVRRARLAVSLDQVAVATSTAPADDAVAQFCQERQIPCLRGSENDVLDRYYTAASALGAETVVRLTADCPLLDPAVIDRVVRQFQVGEYDYGSNTLEPTYPDGLDTEVFTFAALARAWREAALPSEREHVTPYLYKHPELFRLLSVRNSEDLSALRWTVDQPADLELVRQIYRLLGEKSVSMGDVLRGLAEHPELGRLNAGIGRNEGYLKSLGQEGQR